MRLLVPAAACAALFFVTFGVPASVQAVSCPNDECIVTDVIEEYPFIVSLSGDTACTGTVVGGCDGCETGWILTAAHCVYDDEAGGGVDENIEITVAFAPETRYSDAPSEVTLTYDDVFMNDNFRTSGNEEDDWNDDIALLRFDPAYVDWSQVDSVDLASVGSEPSDFYGEEVQVMGYGTTGNDEVDDTEEGDRGFRTLTTVVAPCPENDTSFGQTDIICTQAPDRGDVCAGDSGGPLLLARIINGKPKFLQIGTVSEGYQSKYCVDRVEDPNYDDPSYKGSMGSWNFVPYESEWMCKVTGGPGVGLCDVNDDGTYVDDDTSGDDGEGTDAGSGDDEGTDTGSESNDK